MQSAHPATNQRAQQIFFSSKTIESAERSRDPAAYGKNTELLNHIALRTLLILQPLSPAQQKGITFPSSLTAAASRNVCSNYASGTKSRELQNPSGARPKKCSNSLGSAAAPGAAIRRAARPTETAPSKHGGERHANFARG